jgi:hypothetical protein
MQTNNPRSAADEQALASINLHFCGFLTDKIIRKNSIIADGMMNGIIAVRCNTVKRQSEAQSDIRQS